MSEFKKDINISQSFETVNLISDGIKFSVPLRRDKSNNNLSEVGFKTPTTNVKFPGYLICTNFTNLNKKRVGNIDYDCLPPSVKTHLESIGTKRTDEKMEFNVFTDFNYKKKQSNIKLGINTKTKMGNLENLDDIVEDARDDYIRQLVSWGDKIPDNVPKNVQKFDAYVKKLMGKFTLSSLEKVKQNKFYTTDTDVDSGNKMISIIAPTDRMKKYGAQDYNLLNTYWNLAHTIITRKKFKDKVFMDTNPMYKISKEDHYDLIEAVTKYKNKSGDMKEIEFIYFVSHCLNTEVNDYSYSHGSPFGFISIDFNLGFQ